jgi:hypothetical protein
MTTYLIYIDDSGNEHYDLLSAFIVPMRRWTSTLQSWLDFRRQLLRDHAIPVSYELHASKFLHGRGRPSLVDDSDVNTSRKIRRDIGETALALIAGLPDIAVVTVAQHGTNRHRSYQGLVRVLEAHLESVDGHATLIVDGDEHHPAYFGTHRGLPLANRRIIEDPWMQGSHLSQLIQVADLIAYSAFAQIVRQAHREPLWDLYALHIAPRCLPLADTNKGLLWLPPPK